MEVTAIIIINERPLISRHTCEIHKEQSQIWRLQGTRCAQSQALVNIWWKKVIERVISNLIFQMLNKVTMGL